MLAKDLISEVIPALRTSDTGQKALYWMDIFRISHLPIVNNEDYLGIISDKDIYDLNMAEEPIGNHTLSLSRPYVLDNQHIFEVIHLAAQNKLTVVPVLDSQNHYLGVISVNDLLFAMARFSSLDQPGGIIVLEMNIRDYSLTHISQIVESNDAKILAAYITSFPDSTKLEVTLKINREDLTSIIQSLLRHNYIVKASFMEENDMEAFYRNRLESFLKYLNI